MTEDEVTITLAALEHMPKRGQWGRQRLRRLILVAEQSRIGNYNANPKLSADEKTLVMIHRQEGYAVFKVAAQDLQRGNLRILSNSSLDESPTVAPNGTMVIYATHQQGRGVLMLASINGRVRLPLPSIQGEVREPSWSPYLN